MFDLWWKRRIEVFDFLCAVFGHKWVYDRENTNRVCSRCGREQTVWLNRYPKVGQPQMEWADSPKQRMKDLPDLPQMEELDLHGVKHYAVDRLVENFIFLKEPPMKIITGNSTAMQEIVLDVVNRHGFEYDAEMGWIIVK